MRCWLGLKHPQVPVVPRHNPALVSRMLEVLNVSQTISRREQEPLTVLNQVSFGVPAGHLIGIIGAAGSGKTSLIRLLAGQEKPKDGVIAFQGRDTSLHPVHPNHIGFVGAEDDTLHAALTVRESIMSALMLRVADQTPEQRVDKASHILVGLGLETLAARRVSTLSLPDRRKLKLALALVSDAPLILCDEFADGLDVKSAQELTALLKFVTGDQPGRIVVHATQTLANISTYDTVVILHEGHVCFHGPARAVAHYFSIATSDELYPRLAKRPAERWGDSWSRHRESYYEAFKLGDLGQSLAEKAEEDSPANPVSSQPSSQSTLTVPTAVDASSAHLPTPSVFSQALHLIRRRWSLLRRTQREWVLHLALLLLSPALATLLIAPNHQYLNAVKRGDTDPGTLWPAAYTCSMAIFIQVMLVLAMSVRIGSREIAQERSLFERERLGGLSATAYLLGKLGFLLPITCMQSFSLVLFTDLMGCGLPGNGFARLMLLTFTGLAFTCLCLGISARSSTAERAQSQGWMLLVVNLLLSGALLGFPRLLGGLIQPFITAHYGWSGSIETLQDTPVFDYLTQFVRTWFATPTGALAALLLHAFIGIILMLTGLRPQRH